MEQLAIKEPVQREKITTDSIYQILSNFDKIFFKVNKEEQRLLIDEVHLYTQEK